HRIPLFPLSVEPVLCAPLSLVLGRVLFAPCPICFPPSAELAPFLAFVEFALRSSSSRFPRFLAVLEFASALSSYRAHPASFTEQTPSEFSSRPIVDNHQSFPLS